MAKRIHLRELDLAGATAGQVPAYDAATGNLVWSTPPAPLLADDGSGTAVANEAADDWLYQG